MRRLNSILGILGTICISIMLAPASNAQQATLVIKSMHCDGVHISHPDHIKVAVFDASKIPDIMHLAMEIQYNRSIPAHADFRNTIIRLSLLHKLVNETQAIARYEDLTTANSTFEIPVVSRIYVIAFDKNDPDPIAMATYTMRVSSEQVNEVILNFSAQTGCKLLE
jgi:hypothetical protein